MRLDVIDYKLLDLLQRDARITQSEMAAAVGMTQPAIADRLRKLEQDGAVLGYVARVDPRKLGKDITAFIGVGIEHPKHNPGFAKKILTIPDVLECHHVTGQDSYLLKVVTETTESLDRLISERIRIIPGVTRTHTTIVMSSVKEGSHIKPSAVASQPSPPRGRKRTR
jgi:Lrp/AsnC family leucine-responsive transcriptional regulator